MGGGGNIFKAVADTFTGGLAGKIGGWDDGPDGPKGPPPGGPQGPPADLSRDELLKRKSSLGKTQMPVFLGLSSAMTPLQQRSAIATQGVSGDAGSVDKSVLQYYRSLAYNSLIGQNGEFAGADAITPIEREYLKRAGVTTNFGSTESFLSALDRALGL